MALRWQGPESTGSGRALRGALLAAALLAASLLPACSGIKAPAAESPEVALARADALFDESRFAEAGEVYSAWLETHGEAPEADHAVFRLALVRLSATSEAYDPAEGRQLLARLVRDFPDSPYRPAVGAMLFWYRELGRVREQIEEIKRIDLRDDGTSDG